MPASSLIAALVTALVIGALATVYLRRVRQPREVTRQGVQTLAAMRWREFSQFVVTALQAQGFEASPLENEPNARHHSDMLLTRGDERWLLSCRQAADYRVGPEQVRQMADAVRGRGVNGGLIVTLGRVEPAARAAEPDGIELIDGATLWPLVSPLLPAGLLEHAEQRADAAVRRQTAAAWGLALAFGLLVGALPRLWSPSPAPTVAPVPAPAGTAAVANQRPRSTATAVGAAPPATTPRPESKLSEDEQRQAVLESVRTVPGVLSASWSTRSTLQVNVGGGADDPRDAVCDVLLGFEALRASRVQLQTVADPAVPPRFFHCAAY